MQAEQPVAIAIGGCATTTEEAKASWLPVQISVVISSPLSGVSDVALRAFELRSGRVILSGVHDAPGSDITYVTSVYLLVAALLSSEPRSEPHVSDMSQTQKPLMTSAYLKWT